MKPAGAKRISDLVRDPEVVGRCAVRDCGGHLRATISSQPAVVVCDRCGERQLRLSRIFRKREKKKIRTDPDRRAAFWTAFRQGPKQAGEFLLGAFGRRWETEDGRDDVRRILGCYSQSDKRAYEEALVEAQRQGDSR